MHFPSVGVVELSIALLFGAAAITAKLAPNWWNQWLNATALCWFVAVLLSPADPLSTLIYTVFVSAVYYAGTLSPATPVEISDTLH
jgi:hypothetical protein